MPTAIIIAGPNGAGKTTFARQFLPDFPACETFINADLIAQGLSPLAPETESIRAGKLMLQLIGEAVSAKRTFAIETTLSSKNYFRHIEKWRQQGYEVLLVFISLATPDLAIRRVAQRVREGGHDIPPTTIVRRFHRGKALFPRYCELVDQWYDYENSDGRFILKNSFAQ